MLSRKVDLTENRDFGGSNSFDGTFVLNDGISPDDFNIINDINNRLITTIEEYQEVLKFERIFGKRGQDCINIANLKSVNYSNVKSHCQRCGKALKMPWNNFHGSCGECVAYNDNYLRSTREKMRIPWKRESRTGGIDILHLR